MLALLLLVGMQAEQPPTMKEVPVTQLVPSCKEGYELWRIVECPPPCCTSVNAVAHIPTAIDEKVNIKEFGPVKASDFICRKVGYVAKPKECPSQTLLM